MKKLTTALLAATATFGLAACDVEQTQEGELPEVDVEGGQAPEYDVDAAELQVEPETETVEVPSLDVDVEPADAGEADEDPPQ
ncbi:MAG: hypothetical protein V2I27_03460 [Erythrobacter sp.]|jgi:hypothetical protein|nr:hypothetical protein [Erythrobacter sp.]